MGNNKKLKSVSYAKWGYIFLSPFFIIFLACTLIPLILTVYYSFFDYVESLDPLAAPTFEFVGVQNFIDMFTPTNGSIHVLDCTKNTVIMWIMGAVPQVIFALLLAVIFTSTRLKVKGQAFFKAVIYMPNLIMASAFAMLFFLLFNIADSGAANQIIALFGGEPIRFFQDVGWTRSIVAFINFLMWFGNTTILLMAGIMGIDQSLFEAASIDGAKSHQVFFKVTIPLLKPILVYVVITAMIGGLQMFDVPQLISTSVGNPNGSTQTLIMMLNNYLTGTRAYGAASTLSLFIFAITGILSVIVYKSLVSGRKQQKGVK